MIYNDGIFKFCIEQTNDKNINSLVVLDSCNGFVFRYNYTDRLDKIFRGKSGTYNYYKITFRSNNLIKEMILLEFSRNILKPIYLDDKFADNNSSKLVIRTKKGGLNVKRVGRR